MPVPIRKLSLVEFTQLLHAYRKNLSGKGIDCVHLHCTGKPDHASWRGSASVEAMRRYHMEKGWSDIAQHLTIDPYGGLWTGRPWTRAPASAKGWNSGKQTPFMIEMVGCFDEGKDVFGGEQAKATASVIALIGKVLLGRDEPSLRKGTWTQYVVPHEWLDEAGKTCPGNALWKHEKSDRPDDEQPNRGPRPDNWRRPTADFIGYLSDKELKNVLDDVGREPSELLLPSLRNDPLVSPARSFEAEDQSGPPEGYGDATAIDDYAREAALRIRGRSVVLRAVANDSDLFKRHVIDIENGLFAEDGTYQTRPEDIDEYVLGAGFRDYAKSLGEGATARILVWIHGGINREEYALQRVREMVPFWLQNGIYPIYFVWRTGVGETIGQLVEAIWNRYRGARGPLDWVKERRDEMVEGLAEKPGRLLWNGMKQSGQRAAARQLEHGMTGASRRFCERLISFLQTNTKVELHAVGHSAGSIFLAEMLQAWNELTSGRNGPPSFKTWNFLAPALRTDSFENLVRPHVGSSIGQLAVFAMDDQRERDDNCEHVYGKSLLYLVSRAFEDEQPTPLLGMQRHLLDGTKPEYTRQPQTVSIAEASIQCYWSSARCDALQLTRATSHGGFDRDAKTLNTIVRIVNGNGKLPHDDGPDPALQRTAEDFFEKSLPRGPADDRTLDREIAAWVNRTLPPPSLAASTAGPGASAKTSRGSAVARRRALCVGINAYPSAPLQGCVADCKAWADVLNGLGFDVISLSNAAATLVALRRELANLVDSARPGDALVFQYAGHGSQVPDDDGDEGDGYDEALVPVDYQSAGYLIDDDLYAITQRLPANSSLTLFMDCCHSGTNSRFAPPIGNARGGARVRFVFPDAASLEANRRSRASAPATLAPPGAGARPSPRVVHFAACRDHEYALERDGHGAFTAVAAPLLGEDDSARLRPDEFMRRVLARFANNAAQTPQLLLDADSSAAPLPLFSLVP